MNHLERFKAVVAFEEPDQFVNLWDRPECAGVKVDMLRKPVDAEWEREGRIQPRECFA
jgi:hypothetical protein